MVALCGKGRIGKGNDEVMKYNKEGVSKHKIIKEKDSLYVFILAYNESLFFE